MKTETIRNKIGQRHGLETQTCDDGVLFRRRHFKNDQEFGQQWRNDELLEKKFLEFVSGGHWKEDQAKYPHSKFYFVGDKCMFDFDGQDPKNKHLWCCYSNFWSIFSSDFCMEWLEINRFLIDQVEKHFKLRAATALGSLGSVAIPVEKHFKLRAATVITR